MSVHNAAIQVPKEANKPLHATEITEQLMAAGPWKPEGKTLNAISAFVKASPQTFAPRTSMEATNSRSAPTPADKRLHKAPKPTAVKSGFSFTDCAQKVLEELGGKNKKQMHYREITKKPLEKGWLITGGKTPKASMYDLLITEIKRQQKRGERPRFVQHGRG